MPPVPCFAPASTLPSVPRQQHGDTTPTLLLIILAIVALLAIGYLLLPLFSASTTAEHIQQGPVFSSVPNTANSTTSTTPDPDPAKSADTSETVNKTIDAVASANTDDSSLAKVASTSGAIPDPKVIINAKIPENESLAKEEIDRLEDERKRLAEQEKLGQQQLQLAAEIEQKKAAQIALLQQQIAQLEKDHSSAKP